MNFSTYMKRATFVATLFMASSVFAGEDKNLFDPSPSINKEIDALVQAQLSTKKESLELQKKHHETIIKLYDQWVKLYKKKLDNLDKAIKKQAVKMKTINPPANTPTPPKFPWQSRTTYNLAVKAKELYEEELKKLEKLKELKNKDQMMYDKLSSNLDEFKRKYPFHTNVDEWAKFKL